MSLSLSLSLVDQKTCVPKKAPFLLNCKTDRPFRLFLPSRLNCQNSLTTNERNKQTKKKTEDDYLISLTVTKKNRFCRYAAAVVVVSWRVTFLQRNENERLQHDDDDDDDEEKDGFDAFVVGVDVRVRLCSSGALKHLLHSETTPVASVHASTRRRQLSALDDLENYFWHGSSCHWSSHWKTN